MRDPRLVLECGDMLGECPRWHTESSTLHWLDIEGRRLHRYTPHDGHHETLALTERVSALAFRPDGYIFASEQLISLADRDGNIGSRIAQPDLPDDTRFNDGALDSSGRFWVGTINAEHRPENALYRLQADGTLYAADTGIYSGNGIAWSPDETRLYFVDSRARVIYMYDFDAATGEISNRRPFVHTQPEPGVPDGIAVDRDGCLVCAFWDGWRVLRYDPDGNIMARIDVPVARPTACAFGGPDLKTLYITSARKGLPESDLVAQPLAGSLFACDVSVPGIHLQVSPKS